VAVEHNRPNNLLQQTAALFSVSQGILRSRPPLLSFGVMVRHEVVAVTVMHSE
jgi:hypothetical protein